MEAKSLGDMTVGERGGKEVNVETVADPLLA